MHSVCQTTTCKYKFRGNEKWMCECDGFKIYNNKHMHSVSRYMGKAAAAAIICTVCSSNCCFHDFNIKIALSLA